MRHLVNILCLVSSTKLYQQEKKMLLKQVELKFVFEYFCGIGNAQMKSSKLTIFCPVFNTDHATPKVDGKIYDMAR